MSAPREENSPAVCAQGATRTQLNHNEGHCEQAKRSKRRGTNNQPTKNYAVPRVSSQLHGTECERQRSALTSLLAASATRTRLVNKSAVLNQAAFCKQQNRNAQQCQRQSTCNEYSGQHDTPMSPCSTSVQTCYRCAHTKHTDTSHASTHHLRMQGIESRACNSRKCP